MCSAAQIMSVMEPAGPLDRTDAFRELAGRDGCNDVCLLL
jgi:hypothetical protein